MKQLLYLFLIFFTFSFCNDAKGENILANKTIISGRILSLKGKEAEVKISVNKVGFSQEILYIKTDNLGYFSTSFSHNTPTDLWIVYKSNFLVLTHPGDSIYIEFDGNQTDRVGLLKTVKFSGDAAKINRDAATLQIMYYSRLNYSLKENIEKDFDCFSRYLDSVLINLENLYQKFISDCSPDKETQVWASIFLKCEYFYVLGHYPHLHRKYYEKDNPNWTVPISYYEQIKNFPSVSDTMIMCGYSLSSFIEGAAIAFSMESIINEKNNSKYKLHTDFYSSPLHIRDSLIVEGIIKYIDDIKLKQLVLTRFFSIFLTMNDYKNYERYNRIIENIITEPFLKEPLTELYQQTRNLKNKPKQSFRQIPENIENNPIEKLIDTIIKSNKKKIIYIDCWATWCRPCLLELPNSQALIERYKDEDIAFIFICVDSNENSWSSVVEKYKLEGRHYFLNAQQSTDFRQLFEIYGIPYYFLIGYDGEIIDKGSHLRGEIIEKQFESLLNLNKK